VIDRLVSAGGVGESLWIADAPPGYERITRGRSDCLVRRGYRGLLDCVSADGEPIAGPHAAVPIGTGRTQTTRITLHEHAAEQMVFRRSRRGAMARVVLGDKFVGFHARMFREAAVTAHALERGVPAAEVLVAARERLVPGVYRGWVITREVGQSENLRTYCDREVAAEAQDFEAKRAVLRAVAEAIRKLHDAGVDHPDLNLKNILVRTRAGAPPDVHIIDFDKTRIRADLSLPSRIRNLARLFRSVVKLQASRRWLTPQDLERFLQAYFRRDRYARRQAIRPLTWALLRLQIHSWWWRVVRQPSCLSEFLR
jgi:3-deoxy-D-manno-octulosonic acid kinase